MKNKFYLLLSLALFCFTPVFSQTQESSYVKGDILVQLLHGKDFDDLKKDLKSVAPAFKLQKQISKGLNAYKIHFDPTSMSQNEAKELVWSIPYIITVQNNHYVEERINTPIDTYYSDQWHHKNTGVNGGTVDADVDTDEAWDITTGGTTDFGDEIVVCILEGSGGDLLHQDISDNAWYNTGETPNNGVDDDGNGYIDDFRGWNVGSQDDNIGSGNHGTQVAGMIGAKGDNNQGIAGVNWDVKLMMVSGFQVMDEASVLEGYDYPLTMRKKYDNSNGSEGAYVVVTNASWGIDGGQPADAPLWCNMYDTLGHYGILSCGATANNNVNVDNVGDLPTACPSEYLISVTATNINDERTFSGYGPINIDIGAPGENVFMTENSNDYGTASGTSFATPLTAGVVALLYSAPCPSFIQIAHDDPKLGAEMIRDYIFNGVDYSAFLDGEVATDGRINANNSLQLLLDDCSSGCITPYSELASGITDTEVSLSWGGQATQGYIVEIRESGAPSWVSATTMNTSYSIDTLIACTDYEVRFKALCDAGAQSDYTDTLSFTTDGCCENPSTLNVSAAVDQITATWPSVLAAQSYDLRYREIGATNWIDATGVTSPHTITGLSSCTEYEVEIRVVCANQTLSYTNNAVISTQGCGACLDLTYCTVDAGDTDYEYLNSLTIDSYTNVSGNNNGYEDFSNNNSIQLGIDESYTIEMVPAYTGFSYTENFRIFIDLNHNGTFEGNEELFAATDNNSVSGTITIPASATLGLTKMRCYMADQNSTPSSCITGNYYGEIEDYCVDIKDLGSGGPGGANIETYDNNSLTLYPNPSQGEITLNVTDNGQIDLYNTSGKLIQSIPVRLGSNQVVLNNLSEGVYIIKYKDQSGTLKTIKKWVKQ